MKHDLNISTDNDNLSSWSTKLFDLCNSRNNHIEEIKDIISKHPDLINAQDQNGHTPLHHAVRSQHIDIVKFLIESGACFDTRIYGLALIHHAIDNNHIEFIKFLIEYGINLNNIRDNYGRTLIDYAILKENLEIIKLLAQTKDHIDINNNIIELDIENIEVNNDDRLLLLPKELFEELLSSIENTEDIKNLALSSKTLNHRINAIVEYYQKILMDPKNNCIHYSKGLMKIAIDRMQKDERKLLQIAETLSNNPNKIAQLIHYDYFKHDKILAISMIYINNTDNDKLLLALLESGLILFHYPFELIFLHNRYSRFYKPIIVPYSLVKCRRVLDQIMRLFNLCMDDNDQIEEVKEIILEYPSLIHIKYTGITPLYYAISDDRENVEIVRFLLKNGANANLYAYHNSYKYPFIYWATKYSIRENNIELLKLALERGADINATTTDGENALHYAVRHGHIETTIFLIQNGINISLKDSCGYSPLDIAIRSRGNHGAQGNHIVTLLQKHFVEFSYKRLAIELSLLVISITGATTLWAVGAPLLPTVFATPALVLTTHIIKNNIFKTRTVIERWADEKEKIFFDLLLAFCLILMTTLLSPPPVMLAMAAMLAITPAFNIITNGYYNNKDQGKYRISTGDKFTNLFWDTILPGRFCWVEKVKIEQKNQQHDIQI